MMRPDHLARNRPGPGAFRGARAVALVLCALCLTVLASSAAATTLPDDRAYELVTRYQENGHEVGLNNVETGYGVPSVNGEAVDWAGIGGCCGATSAAEVMYQSDRGPDGWQAKSLTPPPGEPLLGLFEQQVPMGWSEDLTKTIFETPISYAAGAHRPPRGRVNDIYLQGPTGSMDWLSQGPSGTGSSAYSAEFDYATPDAGEVVFSSAEQLTPNATGTEPMSRPAQYLYERDVATETTRLVNVDNNDVLIGPYGASLGNGSWLDEDFIPADYKGTTTHAVSADGSKIFFETPPAEREPEVPRGVVPHLYMRDMANETTTAIDDPNSSSSAQYEGASADGSLVFFTSEEGLDGASTAKELYEFNTTSEAIGAAPPMSAVPISAAGGLLGLTAISNDGSHVYFVANTALAANANSMGHTAVEGQPNLYDYDAGSAQTTFITTLALPDVDQCSYTCESGRGGGLVAEPDISRPAIPTPDGSSLLFEATGNLTGENTVPETTLASEVGEEERTISVTSTAGLLPNHVIEIGSGGATQLEEIGSIDSPTQLTLSQYRMEEAWRHIQKHAAGESVVQPSQQVYRYTSANNSLTCISCLPAGTEGTGNAALGAAGGGSYAPPGQTAPMSEDGSRIFFESSNPLLPGVVAPVAGAPEPRNIYEWEKGHVYLISDGSAIGSGLDGTTRSGDDVFFATRAQLTSSENADMEMIYDARVDGGFPEAPVPTPCTGEDCRAAGAPVFFSTPASSTLGEPIATAVPGLASPSLTVAKITAAQRAKLARTGHLTLKVTGSAAGKIACDVLAKMHGKSRRVARASVTLTHAGTATLQLKLSKAARSALAKGGSLALYLEVSYSASGTVETAELKLAGSKRATGSRRHGAHA